MLALFLFMFSCRMNYYGDIDLGGGYYYIANPSFNSIDVPVNQSEPYAASNSVIFRVEHLGFNQDHIFVISCQSNRCFLYPMRHPAYGRVRTKR